MHIDMKSNEQNKCEPSTPKEQKSPGTTLKYKNMGNIESQEGEITGNSTIEWKKSVDAEKPHLREFLQGGVKKEDKERHDQQLKQQQELQQQMEQREENPMANIKNENISDSQREYKLFIERQKEFQQKQLIALKQHQMNRIQKEKVLALHQEQLKRMCMGQKEIQNQAQTNAANQPAQNMQQTQLPQTLVQGTQAQESSAPLTSAIPATEIVLRKRKPGRPPGSTKKSRILPPETNIQIINTNDFSLRQFFEAGGRDYKDYLEWMQKKIQPSASKSRMTAQKNDNNNNNNNKQKLLEEQEMAANEAKMNQQHLEAEQSISSDSQGRQTPSNDQMAQEMHKTPQVVPPTSQAVPQNVQTVTQNTNSSPQQQHAQNRHQIPQMVPHQNSQTVPQNFQIMRQSSPALPNVQKVPSVPSTPSSPSAPSTPRCSSTSSEHSTIGTPTPPPQEIMRDNPISPKLPVNIAPYQTMQQTPFIIPQEPPLILDLSMKKPSIPPQDLSRRTLERRISSDGRSSDSGVESPCQIVESDQEPITCENYTNITSWEVEKVSNFVASIPECKNYAELFAKEKIDGQTLPYVNEDHLVKYMKMKLGPAIRLVRAIQTIMQSGSKTS